MNAEEKYRGDRPVAPTRQDAKRRLAMVRIIIALAMLACLGIDAFAAEALKKIRIASKGGGEALVPYVIPQRLGFYREEGLDVDVIVTRGTVTTQVVVSGAVDYSNGGSIPAILSGAHLKILLVNSDKPAQYLVTSPKIASIKQLTGKSMAISDTSGNSTLILREFLAKNGVAIENIQMRALGEPAVRLGALMTGAVDATLISYGFAKQAEAKGFRILAYSGDYVSSLSANLETSDDKIQKSPDEVYKVVKATLKGQLFFHRNPSEATKFVMEVLRLHDLSEAKEVWQERSKQSSELAKIGRASDENLTTNIERVREQMRMVGAQSKLKGTISLDQVYDFSFAKKAYDEIRASKWDPMRYDYSKR
jgi:ABC-type nitrate/sulfonate/bicarbonate transport system substrate-binding protein